MREIDQEEQNYRNEMATRSLMRPAHQSRRQAQRISRITHRAPRMTAGARPVTSYQI